METQTIFAVALIVLVMISALQSIEITNIKNSLSGTVQQSAAPQTQTAPAQTQLPSNLQQLPQQIGGC